VGPRYNVLRKCPASLSSVDGFIGKNAKDICRPRLKIASQSRYSVTSRVLCQKVSGKVYVHHSYTVNI
jgi:hypothetical protein